MSQFIEMFKNIPSVKIADCCITVSGGTPNTKKIEYYDGGDIPWLSSGEINQGYIFSTDKYITQLGLENSSAKWVPANSVVIAMYGATAGKVGFIKIPLTTNQAVCTLLPNDGFEPLYLYYATLSKTSWMISQCRGAAQPNISQSIIRSMEIPMATIDEQKRFCKLLTQADKSKFGDFKSQFIEMFGNPLFNTKKWKWYSNINNVVTIVLGSTPNTKEPKYWDGDIKWVTPAEMDDETFMINDTLRHITEFGVKSANLTKLPIGSVLFSTRAPIGKVGIAAAEMYCNQGFKSFICSNQVDSIFLYYTLKLNKEYLCSLGTGTTFKELSKKTVEGLKLGVPPIDLQKQFAIIYKQADKSKSYVWIALKNLESMLGYYIRQVA